MVFYSSIHPPTPVDYGENSSGKPYISKSSTLSSALTPLNATSENGTSPSRSVSQQTKPVNITSLPQPALTPHPSTSRRRAYVLVEPPARNPRQPVGTIKFCKVDGCERWTTGPGKKLARHRETHFPGKVGVVCPACGFVFSRSDRCGDHLYSCDRQEWEKRADVKGTQDAWGKRIGQDLIDESLDMDKDYIPKPCNEL